MIGKDVNRSCLRDALFGVTLLLAWVATPWAHSATVWDGPLLTYNQPSPDPTQAANQDRITSGVWLTRAVSGGLFNAVTETFFTNTSPADTEWAFGTLDNYASLPYADWLDWLNGKSPTTMVGSNIVVHLISEDIYISFKFSFWASKGTGGFTYQRSTPLPPTPTVSITSPAGGAVFAAPANVTIAGSAAVSSGTITNVQMFANGVQVGSCFTAPFSLTASNLAAGSYALIAVATAAGLSTTSTVVNITVVSPAAVTLSGAKLNGGQFSFNYNADPGLVYVVQSSADLLNWASLQTNVATSDPMLFSDPMYPARAVLYRVSRLPNP
jgi:hypothetical protein